MGDQSISVKPIEGDGFLVSIRGEHDLTTAPMLAEQFDELFAKGSFVIADLAETTFLDTQVLAVFMKATKRTTENPQQRFALVVDVEQAHIRHVLEIAHPVIGDIPTFASQQEALTAFLLRPTSTSGEEEGH